MVFSVWFSEKKDQMKTVETLLVSASEKLDLSFQCFFDNAFVCFIFSTCGGGASPTLNPLHSVVKLVVCKINSLPLSISSSWVTLLTTGDVGCGGGDMGSLSTLAKRLQRFSFLSNTLLVKNVGNH